LKFNVFRRSAHPDKGQDFHLRMLGIENRADWTILSVDRRELATEVARGRPDWILLHKDLKQYRIVDYKNRDLRGGDATAYEKYQVVIYAILLIEIVFRSTKTRPKVEAQLLYADGQVLTVQYTEDDVNQILLAASEAPTALFFGRLRKRPDECPSVTDLARYMVDTEFKDTHFDRFTARAAGSVAHESLQGSGPVILH